MCPSAVNFSSWRHRLRWVENAGLCWVSCFGRMFVAINSVFGKSVICSSECFENYQAVNTAAIYSTSTLVCISKRLWNT